MDVSRSHTISFTLCVHILNTNVCSWTVLENVSDEKLMISFKEAHSRALITCYLPVLR